MEKFGTFDITNFFFISVFYLLLFAKIYRKIQLFEIDRKNWLSLLISICCALTALAYFGYLIINIATKTTHKNEILHLCIARGIIWISLAASLIIKHSKWIVILNLLWWVCLFLLTSALSLWSTLVTHKVSIMVEWPLTLLIFIRASMKSVTCFTDHRKSCTMLTEPLLDKKQNQTSSSNSPINEASYLSKLTFWWMNTLLSDGYSKPLTLDDIPDLSPDDEANFAYQNFIKKWECLVQRDNNVAHHRNLVLESIAKVYFNETVLIGVCALVKALATSCSPVLLYCFVNYSKDGDDGRLNKGLILVGILVFVKLVESVSQRHWFFHSRRCGMRMRSALIIAIYQKQLRLSSSGRKRHSTGEVVNYIAVDGYRMGEFPWWFHTGWSLTLQLFLSIVVLFGIVGLGALLGLLPLLVCGLLNIPFAKFLQKCQSIFMVAQDERLRATSEILNNMKIIKLQSWEVKFRNLVQKLRDVEFIWLSKIAYSKATGTALYWMSPTLVSSVVFLGCLVLKTAPLNSGTVFAVLVALRGMSEPVRMIPEVLSVMIQVKVSFDRINGFLVEDELSCDDVVSEDTGRKNNGSLIIESGCFTWEQDSDVMVLKDINLDIKCGQKIAVCGPVGAGKSSLLYALLGEMPKSSGTVSHVQ